MLHSDSTLHVHVHTHTCTCTCICTCILQNIYVPTRQNLSHMYMYKYMYVHVIFMYQISTKIPACLQKLEICPAHNDWLVSGFWWLFILMYLYMCVSLQDYTNADNPFGDHHLLDKFVWHKVIYMYMYMYVLICTIHFTPNIHFACWKVALLFVDKHKYWPLAPICMYVCMYVYCSALHVLRKGSCPQEKICQKRR